MGDVAWAVSVLWAAGQAPSVFRAAGVNSGITSWQPRSEPSDNCSSIYVGSPPGFFSSLFSGSYHCVLPNKGGGCEERKNKALRAHINPNLSMFLELLGESSCSACPLV